MVARPYLGHAAQGHPPTGSIMKEIHVLLVEDNEGDIVLTLEALKEGRVINRVSVVRTGVEAMDFLLKRGEHIDADAPDMVLLDINLPLMNGLEVLERVKTDERLRSLPVVMLTTSGSERDILASYRKYANCYITKPVNFGEFMEVVRSIEDFWVSIVKLPPHGHS
jgi:CheY-like chemotaxis protein